MYYVYRFVNVDDVIIYVGKTSMPLESRLKAHVHLPEACYSQVKRVEFIVCESAAEMAIKEIYYINLYRDNHPYFNILDLSEPVSGMELHDRWEVYRGLVPAHFSSAENGYFDQAIDSDKSTWIDCLDKEETARVTALLVDKIKSVEFNKPTYKGLALRNLVLFELGINTPLKAKDILSLTIEDVFDQNDDVRPFKIKLSREFRDETIEFDAPAHVSALLKLYKQYFVSADAGGLLFHSRKGTGSISLGSYWRLLSRAAEELSIEKNIGSLTPRKTYFMNIFQSESNKTAALLFLDRINGGSRLNNIANYLGLPEAEPDYGYFFSDKFSLGWTDVRAVRAFIEEAF